ncbi:hypothetical protein TorRG33x02_264640, partial [Trema orientale]
KANCCLFILDHQLLSTRWANTRTFITFREKVYDELAGTHQNGSALFAPNKSRAQASSSTTMGLGRNPPTPEAGLARFYFGLEKSNHTRRSSSVKRSHESGYISLPLGEPELKS